MITKLKEQAASITASKIDEICSLIPALANEINWDRGQTKHSRNEVKYVFKNGSAIDVLTASEKSRGQRRHAGLIEEAILIDGDILNEVLIPVANIPRILPDGTTDPDEICNRSFTYITTAGYKNSFANYKSGIGEVKLGEPQDCGCDLLVANNESNYKIVTLCQAA